LMRTRSIDALIRFILRCQVPNALTAADNAAQNGAACSDKSANRSNKSVPYLMDDYVR
jgi:hypothetical protein